MNKNGWHFYFLIFNSKNFVCKNSVLLFVITTNQKVRFQFGTIELLLRLTLSIVPNCLINFMVCFIFLWVFWKPIICMGLNLTRDCGWSLMLHGFDILRIIELLRAAIVLWACAKHRQIGEMKWRQFWRHNGWRGTTSMISAIAVPVVVMTSQHNYLHCYYCIRRQLSHQWPDNINLATNSLATTTTCLMHERIQLRH